MASVAKIPASKYWQIRYRDAAGKQRKRTTKIPHSPSAPTPRERARLASENKRNAQTLAAEIERNERGDATEANLRKLLAELAERIVGAKMETPSTRRFCEDWLDRRRLSPASRLRYVKSVAVFLQALGARADSPIDSVNSEDINAFTAERLKQGVTVSTVATDRKTLSAVFASALRAGLVSTNPILSADPLRTASEQRAPFTRPEVEMLLAEAAGTDWEGAIALAAFAGLRLRDAVDLRWKDVDLFAGKISLRPGKTAEHKRDLVIPISPSLQRILTARHTETETSGLVCPSLAGKSGSGKSGLSMAFSRLMGRAGVDAGEVEKREGQGRAFHRKSFHSLRHYFVAELTAKGVPEDVRMALAGHSTTRAHRTYTHTQLETLAEAVATL